MLMLKTFPPLFNDDRTKWKSSKMDEFDDSDGSLVSYGPDITKSESSLETKYQGKVTHDASELDNVMSTNSPSMAVRDQMLRENKSSLCLRDNDEKLNMELDIGPQVVKPPPRNEVLPFLETGFQIVESIIRCLSPVKDVSKSSTSAVERLVEVTEKGSGEGRHEGKAKKDQHLEKETSQKSLSALRKETKDQVDYPSDLVSDIELATHIQKGNVQNLSVNTINHKHVSGADKARKHSEANFAKKMDRNYSRDDKLWAKCAVLAASSIMKKNRGNVRVAQIAASTILLCRAAKVGNEGFKGETSKAREVASHTLIAVLDAGGTHKEAAAAAASVIGEVKSNKIKAATTHEGRKSSSFPNQPDGIAAITPSIVVTTNDVAMYSNASIPLLTPSNKARQDDAIENETEKESVRTNSSGGLGFLEALQRRRVELGIDEHTWH